jgi:hypothetical protein
MPSPFPRDRDPAPPFPASDLLAELGGAVCPSLTAFVERLIDRQAAGNRGARP